jgi:hypothetical protein
VAVVAICVRNVSKNLAATKQVPGSRNIEHALSQIFREVCFLLLAGGFDVAKGLSIANLL